MAKSKILRDPIHGSIELDDELLTIVDTPQFQRLRRIKQLGGASFVYPGAVHSRFEHSIGVCHIAGELMKSLFELHSKIDGEKDLITREDVLCVQIAALCHDLGHGPFSHLYDKLVKECSDDNPNDSKRKHEYRSAEILQTILEQTDFWNLQQKKDLPPGRMRKLTKKEDLKFIQRMITFSVEFDKQVLQQENYKERFHEYTKKFLNDQLKDLKDMGRSNKVFLLEIVANGLTGVDVDKMDYFARDSHGLGLPNRFDWRRYIQVAKVKKVSEKDSTPECYRLCTLDKEVVNLYELFHTRAVLHQIAYQHKTTRAVEHLLRNVLKKSCIQVYVRRTGEWIPILECWKNMDAFHLLDDSLVDIISKTEGGVPNEPGVSCVKLIIDQEKHLKVRAELSRVIDNRQLPKFVGSLKISKKDCAENFDSAEFSNCNDDHLFSEKITINYGMKELDPLKLHVFYSKHDEHKDALAIKAPTVLVPSSFEEVCHFWYYDRHKHKEDQDAESPKDCLEKLREWARNQE